MDDFRSLPIWQQAHQLVLEVFRATDAPYEARERPLLDDLRRSALGIVTAIVKGHALRYDRPFERYLANALGYTAQVDCLLSVAAEFEYLRGSALGGLRTQVRNLCATLAGMVRGKTAD